MKKKQGTGISNHIFTLGIVLLFLGSFLMLVVFGAASYKGIVERQAHNDRTRELLSYLSTTLGANRQSDIFVEKDEKAESAVLTVRAEDPAYGLRIYDYRGNLVADYGKLENGLNPDNAIILGENTTLKIEEADDGLIKIDTDAGSVLVQLLNFSGEK